MSAACLSLMLVTGCASGTATEPAPEACLLFKPIRPSSQDELTEGTVRQLLEHNETGAAICGWRV